jgi:hypothetical protein
MDDVDENDDNCFVRQTLVQLIDQFTYHLLLALLSSLLCQRVCCRASDGGGWKKNSHLLYEMFDMRKVISVFAIVASNPAQPKDAARGVRANRVSNQLI